MSRHLLFSMKLWADHVSFRTSDHRCTSHHMTVNITGKSALSMLLQKNFLQIRLTKAPSHFTCQNVP